VTVTRLVGGLTPGDGSDPRTFPAIWNATADVIDAVEADSLPTAVGSAVSGDALVYDGAAWVNQPRPGRNLFFNGAMQVHQRGVSSTGITAGGFYTADRWQLNAASAGAWTQTVENDAPTGSGFRKSLKMLCTTAQASLVGSAQLRITQRLEGQDLQFIKKGTSEAQQVTVTFWVKSNVVDTYIVEISDLDNARDVSASYNVLTSNTWEKKIITFPADSTGVLDNDNNASLILNFWLASGTDRSSGGTLQTAWGTTGANRVVGQVNLAAATNNYWQITGVQLEVGPVATPFEFKSFGEELAECQRYYYRVTNDGFKPFGFGGAISTTNLRAFISFPVTMRNPPSSLDVSAAGSYSCLNETGTDLTFTVAPALDQGGVTGATVQGTVGSGLVAGNATQIRANNVGNAILGFNAEL
jgi:hypothetical protein